MFTQRLSALITNAALTAGVLIALTSLGASAAAGQDPDTQGQDRESPADATPAPGSGSEPEVVETVNVTAEFLGDSFSPESVSTAVVDLSESVAASTAFEAATALPGVAENGQAGIFQVLSVRGVSRQRLLSFVDGVRLTSERRAGVSASFVDPVLLGQIEVSRGPASTYYGSGALGGAIQLFPKTYSRFGAAAGFASQGDESFQSLNWGTERVSLAAAHRRADDAETPDGETLFSRFEQTSASAKVSLDSGDLGHHLLVLGSYGEDIGKSSLEFPERITIYPRERHGLARYELDNSGEWRARLWSHAQDLITDASRPSRNQRNVVENSSLDIGGLFEHRLTFGSREFDGRIGLDYFGRRDVDSAELAERGQSTNTFRSLNGGEVDELGGYGVINWRAGRSEFEIGARLTEGRQRAEVALLQVVPLEATAEVKRSRTAVTGFVGAAIELGTHARLIANVGRGLRFPSLTEQFFAGTTGRGQVQGNPELDPEESLNVELSLRLLGQRSAMTVAAYRNRISDYVERVETEPGVLSFVNLTSGRILGLELDGFIALRGSGDSSWRLEGSGHWIDGEASDGAALSDVPAHRLRGSAIWRRGPWSSQTTLEWRAEKDEFGPTERAIDSALLLSGSLSYSLTPELELIFQLENGLDEEYFPSADDRAPLAMGRSVGLQIRFRQ